MILNRCPLCDRGAIEVKRDPDESFLIDCKTCGRFQVPEETLEDGVVWENELKSKRYLLSALSKESTDRLLVNFDLTPRLT